MKKIYLLADKRKLKKNNFRVKSALDIPFSPTTGFVFVRTPQAKMLNDLRT